jgi:hypothetical protein
MIVPANWLHTCMDAPIPSGIPGDDWLSSCKQRSTIQYNKHDTQHDTYSYNPMLIARSRARPSLVQLSDSSTNFYVYVFTGAMIVSMILCYKQSLCKRRH